MASMLFGLHESEDMKAWWRSGWRLCTRRGTAASGARSRCIRRTSSSFSVIRNHPALGNTSARCSSVLTTIKSSNMSGKWERVSLAMFSPPYIANFSHSNGNGSLSAISLGSLMPPYLSPKLVAQISYTEWTKDRRLRHPVFLALRDDKAPKDVVLPEAEEHH